MRSSLPRREGVEQERLPAGPQLHNQRVSQAASLADLAGDYALATIVLLFSHGVWTRDPVADYLLQDPALEAFWMELPLPLFDLSGASPSPAGHVWPDWERRLLLCPRPQWPPLARYLAELGGVDFTNRRVHRTHWQTVKLPDVLACTRRPQQAALPVEIAALTLDGTWGRVHFAPVLRPGGPAPVVTLRPTAEALVYGQAVLTEQARPFAAMEPTPGEAFARLLSGKESTRAGTRFVAPLL